MLTRVWHAQDWDTGVELTNHLLGRLSSLQVHHIFPRALLYNAGYSKADVNAIANFTFLTQETNLLVSDRDPTEYLEEFAYRQPGVVESHWIPMDRALWRVDHYLDFLAARRGLLANAANDFLDSLIRGVVPEARAVASVLEREVVVVPGSVADEEEEKLLRDCNAWIIRQGLPEGELLYEMVDSETGDAQAILDLAWPNGLQEGLSQPVALLIDEGWETIEVVNRAGYRYFTDVDEFQDYVLREVLALEPVE
jgi:hypothetical protein